jgi:hypothetical protein
VGVVVDARLSVEALAPRHQPLPDGRASCWLTYSSYIVWPLSPRM